ncbi:MAG: dihydroxy-acid dehydratase [Candidatus Sulcia muelleri]|uniref:Dihydroxy-acid dehydratase n=1 Tax=Karelsulcia muelleri (strain GWSS) TaxID=444179 RepID=A8Z6B0_KARMG|nr:dihydroxy-acid dehydratase [Candidatus Karelsulcia muelleri GWSS]EAT14125.1 Dihydroxy-acid dehydratase [Candidatus Karelsulcia muelleri str. Hc (Homalodisca coagulata)]MBS0018923.1 dihydroxy-acid dehydratase [Candidatus Karelsulcia muelleri]MCJ7422499.1 dihydroxy-acid dehydratase [Candidatus Karelsulcia muelleri]MCJ7468729.1 dihydroxy-acid dehydratase [Candidatus Karelsulcia muelleri]
MAINTFSIKLTKNSTLPAAQAMLYATGLKEYDFNQAQVGIVSNWYEGNPCNIHLHIISNNIKSSIKKNGMVGFKFNTIGISDGMSMGTSGMRYSLPSRELIADSIESVVKTQHYDGLIGIPGCDKNIPGIVMAMLRINRPSILVYGGSISSGYYNGKKLNIVSAFEALGEKNIGKISELEYKNIIKHACPGPGACGGMYTANTMASCLEAMGITIPYSSSSLANSSFKKKECINIGYYINNILKNNIKPLDIITYKSIKNAITLAIALGGSTNLVIHILAIAKTANLDLKLDDIQNINNNVPIIANLKPSGDFLMEDIQSMGGIPIIIKYLLKEGYIEGDCITVTGNTIKKNLENIPDLSFKEKIIYPLLNPIKKNGHIRILYGNIAPYGAVAKITGKEGDIFSGFAQVFNSENSANKAIINNKIKEGDVIVIRYVGPRGGPGMPEMLKPTSYIMGANLSKKIALITDGRFSGGSHGFVVGHITPEAQNGGLIALIENGDIIIIDAIKNTITLKISKKEIKNRKKTPLRVRGKVNSGYLYKYTKTVSSAYNGCVTDKL